MNRERSFAAVLIIILFLLPWQAFMVVYAIKTPVVLNTYLLYNNLDKRYSVFVVREWGENHRIPLQEGISFEEAKKFQLSMDSILINKKENK